MTRRLLVAVGGGGAFARNTGTGVLSVGSGATITDDTYYNSWPVICRNGTDLVLGYTKAISHHEDDSGNFVAKISTNSGSSWGSEIPAYSDVVTPLFSSVMGLTTLASGRILAVLWRDDSDTSGTGEAGVVYSDDDGVTWSSWIELTNGFTQEAFGAGAAVQLANGDILVPIEGSNSGQSIADRSCHTVRSSDDGVTWGSEVTVRNYVTDTRPYYETCLMLLDNDELIAIHRTSGGTGTHYIQRSTDQGATAGGWGTPSAIFDGYGKPNTIQASSGTLISVTRRNSDAACVAFTSTDRGVTWSSAYVIDSTMFEQEYGAPVELSLGSYLVVYGSQPSSSISNSDIKQKAVTETLA